MKSENGIYGYYDIDKKEIVYIGQSINIFQRHQQHLSPHQYVNQPINRVLQNNFLRYKLIYIKTRENFTQEDRNILEQYYIDFYNTYNDKNKFNYTIGGDGVVGYSVIDKMGGLDMVKKLASLGYTHRQICNYFGLSAISSLYSYLSIRGIKWSDISSRFSKKKKITKEQKIVTVAELIESCGGLNYIKKMSKEYNAQQISDYIGVSKASLKSYLRKHNTSLLILRYS